MISDATINMEPAVIELDLGTASKTSASVQQAMSALGHKRTYAPQQAMSALPPTATKNAAMPKMVVSALHLKADMCSALAHVCFGPKADMFNRETKDRLVAVFPISI